jgi:WD40 repeat protein
MSRQVVNGHVDVARAEHGTSCLMSPARVNTRPPFASQLLSAPLLQLLSSHHCLRCCSPSQGTHIAIGTNSGSVQVWDAIKFQKVRTMSGHTARVGTMAWNTNILASGGRDRMIYLRDFRSSAHFTSLLEGHKQEVCGLKWSFDSVNLASGGNDNKVSC